MHATADHAPSECTFGGPALPGHARSPHGLVQETLDRSGGLYPWRMLVACALLNRARGPAARSVLALVLDRWSTPQAMADADFDGLSSSMKRLGLHRTRASRLIAMSRAYLAFDVETGDPRSLPSVGHYAAASWEMFVRGRIPDEEPFDHALSAYWRWRRGEVSDRPVPRPQRRTHAAKDVALAALSGGADAVAALSPRPSRDTIRAAAKLLRELRRGDVADRVMRRFIPRKTWESTPKVGESRVYRVGVERRGCPMLRIPARALAPTGSHVLVSFRPGRIVIEMAPEIFDPDTANDEEQT